MKTNFLRLWMASGFMLFFQMHTQAQYPSSNLHQTVTHESGPPDRMPISNDSHKEGIMPQQDKDFGTWNGLVTIYKQHFDYMLPKIERSGFGTGIPLSTLDYKKFTKDDLRALATSYNGFHSFESLIAIKNGAIGQPEGKLSEKDIQDARNALQELAPNGWTWKKLFNTISDLQEETEAKREVLRARHDKSKRHGAALKELSSDIAGDPLESPEFTQQKAKTLLEKAGVVKDSADGLKKPLETAVTDAVKGVKSTITIAA